MAEYKEYFPTQPTVMAAVAKPGKSRNHGRSLAEKFGITSGHNEHTSHTVTPVGIEEELNAYLGVQIQGDTDPVGFWEVRTTLALDEQISADESS